MPLESNIIKIVEPYADILASQRNRLYLSLKNNTNTAQTIRLFDISNDPNGNILYNFTLPYAASYASGLSFSFDADGTTYTYTTSGTETPTQVATGLTALGQGTWSVSSDVTDGNIFSISSETVIYSNFETIVDGTWTAQTSGTSNNMRAIFFIDANTGWSVGDSGLILHTIDGGTTWTPQVSGTANGVYSVFFIDANIGWAGCSGSIILYTTNGGTTWTSSITADTAYSLSFINATTGWASCGNGNIFNTTDGGITWTPQVSGTLNNLYSISFTDSNTGWICGQNGTLLYTTDGGTTWTPQVSGTLNDLNGISFTDSNTGWICGSSGVILHTTNGGATWTPQVSGTLNALNGISFTDSNTGWICNSSGVILHTTNGGATWTSQVGAEAFYLFDIFFIDAHTGWASGIMGLIETIQGTITPSSLLSESVVSVTGSQEFNAFLFSIIQKQYDICFIALASNLGKISDVNMNYISRTQDAIVSQTPMSLDVDKYAKQGNSITYYNGSPKVSLTGLTYVEITIPANDTIQFYGYYQDYSVAPEVDNKNYVGKRDADDVPSNYPCSQIDPDAKLDGVKKEDEFDNYEIGFKIAFFNHKIKAGSGLITKN